MYKLVDQQLCLRPGREAQASPHKRSHYNLHEELTDPVQRLCIALHQGSYVQPHRHPEDFKWEMMLIISGTVRMLIFDDIGKLIDIIELSEQDPYRPLSRENTAEAESFLDWCRTARIGDHYQN